jgi:hypothetical protein
VQSLLGHAKIESTVRYLAVDIEDALELSEQTEIYSGETNHGRLVLPDRNTKAVACSFPISAWFGR